LTTAGGTTSYEGAYGQLVSLVGNRTNELNIMSEAEAAMLEGAYNAQQAYSGVNLDEEAANLIRYQQAYQAASKMMQIASQLFELLLTIGH
jgi:flagellar hook-associated protein 1 FlgK